MAHRFNGVEIFLTDGAQNGLVFLDHTTPTTGDIIKFTKNDGTTNYFTYDSASPIRAITFGNTTDQSTFTIQSDDTTANTDNFKVTDGTDDRLVVQLNPTAVAGLSAKHVDIDGNLRVQGFAQITSGIERPVSYFIIFDETDLVGVNPNKNYAISTTDSHEVFIYNGDNGNAGFDVTLPANASVPTGRRYIFVNDTSAVSPNLEPMRIRNATPALIFTLTKVTIPATITLLNNGSTWTMIGGNAVS